MEEVVDEARDPGAIVGEADVTEADLAQALTRRPGSNRPWLAPVVMIVAAVLSLGLSLHELNRESMLTVVLPMGFVVTLVMFIQRGVRRGWIKQAFSNIGGPTTFRFDDYGFSSESSLRQHRLAWAGLARALETPQAFLIYTTPRTVLIVPKRAFTAAEVATLGPMLRERITPKSTPTAGLFPSTPLRMLVLWVVVLVMFLSIWHYLEADNEIRGQNHGHRDHRDHRDHAVAPTTDGEASDVDSSP